MTKAGSDQEQDAKRTGGADRAAPHRTYELRIELLPAALGVERRVAIPAETTLADLHVIVQAAMGWMNAHLHAFVDREGRHYGALDQVGEIGHGDESEVIVADVLQRRGHEIGYEYDFGDGWAHRIKLAAVHDAGGHAGSATCIEGRGSCPPEDCGGAGSYLRLRDIWENPDAGWTREDVTWAKGIPREPEFNADAATSAIRRRLTESRQMEWEARRATGQDTP